ncbi:MAG: hypothetical protein KGQ40_07070 [Rhodospirillales bacterium]|nr:hypothetical protein [Rhodospirillales bacterium]
MWHNYGETGEVGFGFVRNGLILKPMTNREVFFEEIFLEKENNPCPPAPEIHRNCVMIGGVCGKPTRRLAFGRWLARS